MSSLAIYILDTALIGVSFFNTIVMLWLGLTVILNAERRAWGTWAAGGGILFGALFFAIHSTVVGQAIWNIAGEMGLWWRVGWAPFVAAPYLWYLVMAWYSGALREARQRVLAATVGAVGAAALLLLLVANPLPTYDQILRRTPIDVLSVAGVPLVVLIYPAYSVLCIVLSLVVLRHPAASERFMGDLGRMRARPWLVAASLGLLLVGLVAGVGVGWLLNRVRLGEAPMLSNRSLAAIITFDLILTVLIAVVVVLLGNAVVAYEIFTGKALPRGGLARYWRGTLILAGIYGLLVGASTDLPIAPIYRMVLVTVLVTALYAVMCWRAFVERERGVERLRPFVSSQRLYEQWLGPHAAPEVDIAAPFRALCDDVLNTRVAYLAPLGPLASLGSVPLIFPEHAGQNERRRGKDGVAGFPSAGELAALPTMFTTPQQLCVPVEQARYGGAGWAVPLWSERGLAGVLLLGEKRGGGLYTQEEIEIARATGERLLDTQASAEMARRLVALQRQRLAESQVLDRRTRRVLHDDVLPRIHAAMLDLGAASWREENGGDPARGTGTQEAITLLADVHHQIANLLRELPPTAEAELVRLGLVGALRNMVEGELRGTFDTVQWHVAPGVEAAASGLSTLSAEVLFYAARETIRNAARHGRGGEHTRPLTLCVGVSLDHSPLAAGSMLTISVEDDGVGLGSTRGTSGSGQGLALHSTMLAVLGGALVQESLPGGARFVLSLPCEPQLAAR